MNQPIEGKPGRYWHVLEDGRIQCDVCPRYCKLHEGQRGLCFVRARQDHQMVLTTYGRSSGFCIDPIEKKPLNHFLPGTPVLSFGTAGCNLTCKFCQNWDISKARDFDRIQDAASPEMIAEAAVRSGCRSVAFTYNDPVIFLEYAVDVAQACRERGIKTVAVSAGYISPEPRTEFFRHMDAANIDLKGFTDGFYKNLCSGSGRKRFT
jgi:pyruvate formate lyase activating enzyme